jgi:hypothetical protein
MAFVQFDYPREVLEIGSNGEKGYRRLVDNSKELSNYWGGKNGSGNVYMTAYGYRATQAPKHHRVDYNTPIIRHFVLDFDCKDFRNKGREVEFAFVQEQVRRLHQHFLVNDYEHYIWMSGGGFHIWVPILKTLTPSNGLEVSRIKNAGKKYLVKLHKELDLPSNDPTVAFDTAGMIRIPNSYNMKRGCWSIPLTHEEIMSLTHDDLIELAQEPRSGAIQHGTVKFDLVMPDKKQVIFTKQKRNIDLPEISLDKILILPCIAQAALGEGNPIHRARFHLANYLAARLRYWFPPEYASLDEKAKHAEQIINICQSQGWVDFDINITTTQVNSIVYGDYHYSTCKTLIMEGLCTGICNYYDGTAEDII